MKIRAGYEISYDCPQPTPMILTLSVHPSRVADLITLDRMRLDPPIVAKHLSRQFRQFLPRHPRARRPADDVGRFLIRDNGQPDAIAPQADSIRSKSCR